MNHKQRSAPFTNIGSSSLLVVFLVLCLVTFGTVIVQRPERRCFQ